jgi:hypothetical protein
MQTLAFLCFELEVAQQSLRESFVESQVPAKAGMASGPFWRRRTYESIKDVFLRRSLRWDCRQLRRPATIIISLQKDIAG